MGSPEQEATWVYGGEYDFTDDYLKALKKQAQAGRHLRDESNCEETAETLWRTICSTYILVFVASFFCQPLAIYQAAPAPQRAMSHLQYPLHLMTIP